MVFWRRTNKDTSRTKKTQAAQKRERKPRKEVPVAFRASSANYWNTGSAAADPGIFDGATERRFDLVAHKGLAQLTIDLRLKSRSVPVEDLPASDTTPEMPLLMGNKFSLSTMSKGYAVTLKDDDGKLFIRGTYGDPATFTRFTVVSDADGTALFCDGVEVARSSKVLGIGRSLRVGAGRKDRFWAGEFQYCDIYSIAKVRSNFTGSIERFGAAGRIVSLDS